LAVALAVTLTGWLTNTCDCHELEHEYRDLMFEYKALSAEYARLQYQCSGVFDIQEPYSSTTEPLPYYVPVDIQEPLPYVANDKN
jgi:hypothetical protein